MIRNLVFACSLAWCCAAALCAAQEPASPPTEKAPELPQGELPWQASSSNQDARAKVISPQAMLKILGIDESHLQQLTDGRDLSSDDDETLTKLLFRLPRFDPPQWERWCQKEVPWESLASEPGKHRADCFLIRGRALQVERVPLIKERIELYEYSHYYRVRIAVEGVTNTVVVCTRTIPDQWKDTTELDEPVGVHAMFVKAGEPAEQGPTLYFAAARLAWYPDQVNAALGVNADLVWLAARGMDISLWDDVRDKNGAAVSAQEAECFYQLLGTLNNATPEQIKSLQSKPFDLGGLLQSPQKFLGDAFNCQGTARRIQKVNVPLEYQQRMGLDHYYEIDLFVPLDKQAVRLTTKQDEKDAPIFTDGFPTTFCVAKLPPELKEGVGIKENVRLKGIFFKQWAYSSEFLSKFEQKLKQPAPLLIGLEPQLVKNESPIDTSIINPTTFMLVILAGIMAVWFVSLRFSRGDRKFGKAVLRKYAGGKDPPDSVIKPPPENS